MKKQRYALLAAPIVAAVILAVASVSKNPTVDYSNVAVKKVVDGDTVELENGRMVRYIGIDTPETRRKVSGGWVETGDVYGLEAKRLNEEFVSGRSVRLEFDLVKEDKYNRLLAYCFTDYQGREILVQEELLRKGLAFLYTFPPNVKYVDRFVSALKEARDNRRGIWSQDLSIPSSSAVRFIGQRKIIEGVVKKTRSMESLVRLETDGVIIVIFKNDLDMFLRNGISPASYYKNKKVQAFGYIKEYKGEPEIIVSHPSQIEIVE